MRRRLCACLLAAAAAFSGCGLKLPASVQLAPAFSAPGTPYGDALERRTRRAELYQGFDTVAKGWATWKTGEVRSALAEASVDAYHLEGAAAEGMREEARLGAAGPWEFHLAVYMPRKQWNDLESPDSLWRVHVELPGGGRLEPLEVKALAKTDKNPVQYPYVTPWTREYALTFPVPQGATDAARLVVAGPLGTMTFAF